MQLGCLSSAERTRSSGQMAQSTREALGIRVRLRPSAEEYMS